MASPLSKGMDPNGFVFVIQRVPMRAEGTFKRIPRSLGRLKFHSVDHLESWPWLPFSADSWVVKSGESLGIPLDRGIPMASQGMASGTLG